MTDPVWGVCPICHHYKIDGNCRDPNCTSHRPPPKEGSSSGYQYLSDKALVETYDWAVLHTNHVPNWWEQEAERRGWVIKDCSECGKNNIHNGHDYICILCRG